MSNPTLDLVALDYDQLVALRTRVDARIEELRQAAAEHYGLALPAKRNGRRPRKQQEARDDGDA
ncbi:MAG: hypothetical protein AB7F99_00720 [Vicinamibacterales bacterium]